MTFLEKAIIIAVEAHQDVKDKCGEPYILHPLRMMVKLTTEDERITAVLHDVVEDTEVTMEDLKAEGFSQAVLTAVDLLTHDKNKHGYEEFIQRLAPNPIARAVKLKDLEDNMDLRRLPNPTPKDLLRLEKYQKAVAYLMEY